jgi:hypothetical protein
MNARPLAQFDHQRIVDAQTTEGPPIAAQRGRQYLGIAAIVLGAGHREAITEAIELLRVDGKRRKPTLEQRFHHRTARRLDRNGNRCRRRCGLPQQPIA